MKELSNQEIQIVQYVVIESDRQTDRQIDRKTDRKRKRGKERYEEND